MLTFKVDTSNDPNRSPLVPASPLSTGSYPSVMRQSLPAHVHQVRNKTGRPYLYFQRNRGTKRAGKRVRLPDDPRSPEFWQAYAALAALPEPQRRPDTIGALVAAWKDSHAYVKTAASTKRLRQHYLDRYILAAWADIPVRTVQPSDVLALQDRLALSSPAVANGVVKTLSSIFAWSVPRGYRPDNPCREVRQLALGEGRIRWPSDVIEQARRELHPAHRDVLDVALYTGQRQGDVLALTWAQVGARAITLRQRKTNKALVVPIHAELAPVLARIAAEQRARFGSLREHVLLSKAGLPWREFSFRKDWARHAPAVIRDGGYAFHGLRRSAVAYLLEAGCSDAEVSAITGQSRAMVEHYAKDVRQAQLALTAMRKWEKMPAWDTREGGENV